MNKDMHTKGRLYVSTTVQYRNRNMPVYIIQTVEGRQKLGEVVADVICPISENYDGEDLTAERLANARRLVACWNACQGIKTKELEIGLPNSPGSITLLDRLKAQTDGDDG